MYEDEGREGNEIGMLIGIQIMGGVGKNCVNAWGACLLLVQVDSEREREMSEIRN